MDENNFFLVFESSNPDFQVSILDEGTTHTENKAIVMDLKTYTGNLVMAMSSSFFKKKLNYFKESGNLRFLVKHTSTEDKQESELDYTITIIVQK